MQNRDGGGNNADVAALLRMGEIDVAFVQFLLTHALSDDGLVRARERRFASFDEWIAGSRHVESFAQAVGERGGQEQH